MQERRGPKIEIIPHSIGTTHTLYLIPITCAVLPPILIATPPRLENRAKSMNAKEKTFSNRNKKRRSGESFRLLPKGENSATGNLMTAPLPLTPISAQSATNTVAKHSKINRNTGRIESPVSHSKQKAAPQINRNISRPSCLPFPLFTFPFSAFKRETPSVAPGFGVCSQPSAAPASTSADTSNPASSKELADAR
jgi:hypothetical protein